MAPLITITPISGSPNWAHNSVCIWKARVYNGSSSNIVVTSVTTRLGTGKASGSFYGTSGYQHYDANGNRVTAYMSAYTSDNFDASSNISSASVTQAINLEGRGTSSSNTGYFYDVNPYSSYNITFNMQLSVPAGGTRYLFIYNAGSPAGVLSSRKRTVDSYVTMSYTGLEVKTPSVSSPSPVLVGNTFNFTFSGRDGQLYKAERSRNENGVWSPADWSSANWVAVNVNSLSRSVYSTKSAVAMAVSNYKNNTWSSYTTSYTYAKLLPPTSVTLNKDIFMYGIDSLEGNYTVTHPGSNPTGTTDNIEYNGHFFGDSTHHYPKYTNDSRVRVSISRNWFEDSNYVGSPKVIVQLNPPILGSNQVDETSISGGTSGKTIIGATTIGNNVTILDSSTAPKPATAVLNCQWYKGLDDSSVTQNTRCQIKSNYYKAEGWVSYSSGNYSLRNSVHRYYGYIVARRCPRGLTLDDTFKNGFKFLTYDTRTKAFNYNYFSNQTDNPILTLNNQIYVKFPSYSANKNLGRFNCYKVEFIQNVSGTDYVRASITKTNNPEVAVSPNASTKAGFIVDPTTLIADGKIIPGESYFIKFTAGYKKDTSLDDGNIGDYNWNPTQIDSSHSVSESSYADTNVFYSNYKNGQRQAVLIGGAPATPELLYPYYSNNSNNRYITLNSHARIIFKVYSPSYIADMPEANVDKVYVSVTNAQSGTTSNYEGTIETDSETNLQYFSSSSDSNFAFVRQDIGYPRSNSNNPEDPDTNPVTDNNGNIIYDPIGESITRGSIIAFNLEYDNDDTYKDIEIWCKNGFNITSVHATFRLTRDILVSTESGDQVVANNNNLLNPVNVVTELGNIIRSYSKFVDTNTSTEIATILNNSFTPNEFSPTGSSQDWVLVRPDATKTLDEAMYSWHKAIRKVYTEVYRKTYVASCINTVITDTTPELSGQNVVTLNKSLYHNVICNIEGVRTFKYVSTVVNGVTALRWCQTADGDDDAFIIGSTSDLEHYGITINGATPIENSTIELTTTEQYIIDVGKIYPKEAIQNTLLEHHDTLSDGVSDPYELYSKYENGRGYRQSLLDLVVDLLRRMI